MGGPSAAIVVEELIALGARRLVRVGTCGALDDGRGSGRCSSPIAVLARDGTSRALGAGDTRGRRPGPARGAGGRAAARRRPGRHDRPLLRPATPARPSAGAPPGAIAVEMEAAAVLDGRRALRGVAAACLLLVSTTSSAARAHRRRGAHARRARARPRRAGRALGSSAFLARLAASAPGLRRPRGAPARAASAPRASSAPAQRAAARRRAWRAGSSIAASRSSTPASRRRAERLEPLVEPVDAVLDALEALRDRAQAPRQPLDVGRRRDVERAHRGLLRLHRALARLERPGDRAVDERVLEQILRDLARARPRSAWRAGRAGPRLPSCPPAVRSILVGAGTLPQAREHAEVEAESQPGPRARG